MRLLTLLIIAILTGCSAGDGEGLDEAGRPLSPGNPSSGNPDDQQNTDFVSASYNDIQAKVFTPTCAVSGCHSGASAPLGLRLDADSAFDLLVNQASVEQTQLLLIEPGNPDNSYLVQKLEGTAAVGQQMPRGQPPLSVETIQAIRLWIEQGALGPQLSSIQATVFSPRCISCHFGSSPAADLSLESGLSFSNLVGVKRNNGAEIRVVVGEANRSFLMDKLRGHKLDSQAVHNPEQNRGNRMPLGGPYLEEPVIDVIQKWIDAGAENN